MKLAAAVLAAAGLVASPPAATASQVVKTVKVVGSDKGGCKFLEEVAGCDANFVLIAREFADGTTKGQLTDVNKFNLDGVAQNRNRGSVECVRIYEDESFGTVAVVAGTWDNSYEGIFDEGDTWWTVAAIVDGTPYYTTWWPSEIKSISFGPYEGPDEICDNAEEAAGIVLENGFDFEHLGGQVTIDKLACEDLRSEKKCGKFVRQCKWDEEEEACLGCIPACGELCFCSVGSPTPPSPTPPSPTPPPLPPTTFTTPPVPVAGIVCAQGETCVAVGDVCGEDFDSFVCECVMVGEEMQFDCGLIPASHKVEYATAAKEPHAAGATAKVSVFLMLAIVPATLLWMFN